MALRHYYYTSYVHKQTGHAGFQVKAMSPGISPRHQAVISRLVTYRIPPSLDTGVVQSHPVALRYTYEEEGISILLCSQSCGSDEYGRPGNFFAHALLLSDHSFTRVPPIFFWKSPLWCSSDSQERTDVLSLPILSCFDEPPSLDMDEVWRFLAQGNRHNLLYRLLCAVIHRSEAQRRIIVLDSSEHVALWIAAVSCLLPPAYRPLLTFATYHHSPQQSPYLITGTTEDCFSPSLADFQTCFILDGKTGRTSSVADSVYARLATDAAHSDLYEANLLPIFLESAERFPRPGSIDEHLESIAHYSRAQRKKRQEALTTEEFQAVQLILPAFERIPVFMPEESDELTHLVYLLHATLKVAPTPALYQEFYRVQALLNTLGLSLDPLILSDLVQITEAFLEQLPPETALINLYPLYQLYGQQDTITTLNSPAYLDWLNQRIARVTSVQLIRIWQEIGCYILPTSPHQHLVCTTLICASQLYQEQYLQEVYTLLTVLRPRLQVQPERWFSFLVENKDQLPAEFCTFLSQLLHTGSSP